MTLRHMRVFVSVFRQGSITRAAEELHLTQPPISLVNINNDNDGIKMA